MAHKTQIGSQEERRLGLFCCLHCCICSAHTQKHTYTAPYQRERKEIASECEVVFSIEITGSSVVLVESASGESDLQAIALSFIATGGSPLCSYPTKVESIYLDPRRAIKSTRTECRERWKHSATKIFTPFYSPLWIKAALPFPVGKLDSAILKMTQRWGATVFKIWLPPLSADADGGSQGFFPGTRCFGG